MMVRATNLLLGLRHSFINVPSSYSRTTHVSGVFQRLAVRRVSHNPYSPYPSFSLDHQPTKNPSSSLHPDPAFKKRNLTYQHSHPSFLSASSSSPTLPSLSESSSAASRSRSLSAGISIALLWPLGGRRRMRCRHRGRTSGGPVE